jgi:hypothetical protein
MTTDHGTHPADKWADMISQMILPISDDIAHHRMLAAKKLQITVAEAIEQHVQEALDAELKHLTGDAAARFAADHDGHQFADPAHSVVMEIVGKSVFADQVRVDPIRDELIRHFNAIQQVERLHFHDKNPSEAGAKYRAQFHTDAGV